MSEFMSIKRNLLEEQSEAIDSETRKYSRLLENRTNEVYISNKRELIVFSWIEQKKL